jgi:hypothetical protein
MLLSPGTVISAGMLLSLRDFRVAMRKEAAGLGNGRPGSWRMPAGISTGLQTHVFLQEVRGFSVSAALPPMKALFLLIASLLPLSSFAAEPLVSQFGTKNHVECIPGDLPLILCSPHGGALKPEDIPDRSYGVTGADANTQQLTKAVAEEIAKLGGHRPHLILSHLHRSKLDPNREVKEAAQGNVDAIKAWEEYHRFIEQAREAVVKQHGMAFLIDMHGQNHPGERVELGYLHKPDDFSQDPETLNSPAFAAKGSLAHLMTKSKLSYVEVLHGPRSFGALLEAQGYHSTPSPRLPVPDQPYFSGGYTIVRHCKPPTTGFQLEAQRVRLRDTEANRRQFARTLAAALEEYLREHLGIALK